MKAINIKNWNKTNFQFDKLKKIQNNLMKYKLYSLFFHSNLEDVLVEKKFPKKSDDKFIKYSSWTTQIHQDLCLDGFGLGCSKDYI